MPNLRMYPLSPPPTKMIISHITIQNFNVSGAIRYRIYRGIQTAQMQGYLLASGTTFTDDGTVALISGTPPLTNESGSGHIDYVIIR